jgi:hypothetical protein
MELFELKAELSVTVMELERAIDAGMPYPELRRINLKIKDLHYQIAMMDLKEAKQKDTLLIE